MKCPKCGNINQEDALFCDQCGSRLVQPAAADPEPAQETVIAVTPEPVAAAPAGSACPQCGMVNTPGEMFCSECGAPLDAPVPEELPVAEQVAPVEFTEQAPIQVETAVVEETAEPETVVAAEPVVVDPVVSEPVIAEPVVAEATPAEPTCPKCGKPVAPDDVFCSSCGSSLAAPKPEPIEQVEAVTQVAAVVPEPVQAPAPTSAPAPNECPACGAQTTPGAAFCDFCGAALGAPAPAPQAAAPQPAQVVAAPSAAVTGPRLVIAVSGTVIPLPEGSEVIVGREDPVSGIFPEVDLSPHGGEAGGVSRRHLKITLADGQYAVQDLNSTNYTWLNQNRLQAGMPVVLRDGDELRAGKVRMQFKVS